MNAGIVIVGGGQAGVQVAGSLRTIDAEIPITIVADELQHPYQRPPLSKSLWSDDISKAAIPLRSAEFFSDRKIALLTGVRAVGIDRETRRIDIEGRGSVPYDALVIATGARARSIRLPGADLPGVHRLRTLDDGLALQQELRGVDSLLVIGAGFVGLEVAASALQHGVKATVFEVQDRILARALTPTISQWLTDFHRRAGMDVRLSSILAEIVADENGRAAAVITDNGERIGADLVVTGVGAVPNTEFAAAAGLLVDDGVVVDEHLRTDDPAIWAIGDCVRFPSHFSGTSARVESVQNATDQGIVAAKNIIATLRDESQERYVAVPWFWSNQGHARLQIAGIGDTAKADVVIRDYGDDKISVFVYEGEKLTAVESVNVPADHIAARRIIAAGGHLDPSVAADPTIPLKSLIDTRAI
ncbi:MULTISPECIES: FAD-dependent oxidoreductase [unclassified Mycolicibacterium]|uniref:NAD(P)/FAD-dependent oxidoreductase n=1 Tax=unclassified Mycolicibacterium TaxID=2636767 RepID=UPI0013910897|nr:MULTISPECIES: FAD-dependent oxidoreductase [unclassified Mycolicibacterium]